MQPFVPPTVTPPDRPLGVLASVRAVRRNVLNIIPEIAYTQPIVTGRTGPARWHMVQGPEGLRRIFLDNADNYPKSEVMIRMLRPAVGSSLFTAEGAEWRWQRRAIAPVFAARNVAALAPMMTKTAERASARVAAAGETLEMVREMLSASQPRVQREAAARQRLERGSVAPIQRKEAADFSGGCTSRRDAVVVALATTRTCCAPPVRRTGRPRPRSRRRRSRSRSGSSHSPMIRTSGSVPDLRITSRPRRPAAPRRRRSRRGRSPRRAAPRPCGSARWSAPAGRPGRPGRARSRGLPVSTMAERNCSAAISPSPVVTWSVITMWPDCSPPRL